MQPSMLEEIVQNPNPYPIVADMEYPEVWRLCTQARELAWDPAAIDFSDVINADIPDEVRKAGAEWWSLRAWMEHGATPYGAERLRDAVERLYPQAIEQGARLVPGVPASQVLDPVRQRLRVAAPLRNQHDERRQILILAAQSIR
mgnify:CR=1 FL=1